MPFKIKAVLVLLTLITSLLCGYSPKRETTAKVSATAANVTLSQRDGEGEEALNGFIFFGESTTAHLSRKGGVMDTSEKRRQVWRDDSGTRQLNLRTVDSPVKYFDKSGNMTVLSFADAVATERPTILVLSFGLNGLEGFVKEPATFLRAYNALIEKVEALSPGTRIILQSIYPVGENQSFKKDVQTVNSHIRTLNQEIEGIASQHRSVQYADTASVLQAADGSLLSKYDAGDGIHLTNEAYEQILLYLHTHV
ncbi:MAG: SGNH/GDSL hydrolase family protein [Clostridia bacterium]|nr:SGNH/GDSL hydrolase family protein [Clostridia bacterium]